MKYFSFFYNILFLMFDVPVPGQDLVPESMEIPEYPVFVTRADVQAHTMADFGASVAFEIGAADVAEQLVFVFLFDWLKAGRIFRVWQGMPGRLAQIETIRRPLWLH